jgi:hypothetical protein
MAYAGGQLTRFASEIEKLLRDAKVPRAILLSGGGNDVAGDEFGMLVNHKASSTAGLNAQVVRGVIDDRARHAYIAILAEVTRVCQARTGKTIPIIIHGYDWPVPDGRGFLFGPFPGPWLEPGFRRKGFDKRTALDFARMRKMSATLIDRFNEMLAGVAGLAGFEHVRYLNLRDTLSTGADYRKWWANELHPTERGFTAVADSFARKIEGSYSKSGDELPRGAQLPPRLKAKGDP